VEAPWWLIVTQAAALLGILSAIGLYLDRRKWYWTL
jgi:ascorbate-specific PTS system EIIC-type component UlaA